MSKKNDFLWYAPRDSWRLAAAIGTIVIILIAVVMHIFGWIIDSAYLIRKALWGLLYAIGYFILVIIGKIVYEYFLSDKDELEEAF